MKNLRKFLIFYAVLGVAIGIEILADVFLKKSNVVNLNYLLIGTVLYGATAIPVAFLFNLSHLPDLNRGPSLYKRVALPLS